MSSESGSFSITLRVQDVLQAAPLAGVEARLCRNFDVNCENPQAGPVMSDDFGVVRFEVRPDSPPLGFSGFVSFTRSDLMPGMYFFNSSIDRAVDISGIQLLNTQAVGVLTQLLDAEFDPERGLVLISAYDCKEEPADGVMLMTDDTDEFSATFYSVKGIPALGATATDLSGYAGIFNVPPGRIAVTGRLNQDGRILASLSLLVKAGSITYSRMAPRGA